MASAATVTELKPKQQAFSIPVPTERKLHLSTRRVSLPQGIEYGVHDEFAVTLRCRIEKVAVESPLDDFGHPSRTTFLSYATVLAYEGDDFAIVIGEDATDGGGDDDEGDD